jgi:hypothetical protein
MDEEIASTSLAIESFHPLSAKCDHCCMLCACLDGDISLAEYREIESLLDTECCLRWRYMHRVVEICSISSESTLIFWNSECDIEIAVAISSLVSFTSDFDRHPILDAFWDIDRLFDFFFEFSFAMTIYTLLDHSLSCAVAR